MSRKEENQGFICENCKEWVNPLSNGSYRNHCSRCLYSLHVDQKPGDRKNACKGLLQPIGVRNRSNKGMQLIHQCSTCGEIKFNKVAIDDCEPDDMNEIIKLMQAGCSVV